MPRNPGLVGRTPLAFTRATREALDHLPIRHDDHAGFIAGLQKLLDPVERARNCVAHHRTIPKRTLDDYPQAREDLHRAIQEFWDKVKQDPMA